MARPGAVRVMPRTNLAMAGTPYRWVAALSLVQAARGGADGAGWWPAGRDRPAATASHRHWPASVAGGNRPIDPLLLLP